MPWPGQSQAWQDPVVMARWGSNIAAAVGLLAAHLWNACGGRVTGDGSAAAAGVGQNAVLRFRPDAPGRYYLRVAPLAANLFGTEAVYRVAVLESKELFLPLVIR